MPRVACSHLVIMPDNIVYLEANRPQALLDVFKSHQYNILNQVSQANLNGARTNLSTSKTNANRAALIAHIVLSVFCALALAAAVAACILVPGLAVGLMAASIAVPLVTAVLGNVIIHLLNKRQQNRTLADQIQKETTDLKVPKPEATSDTVVREYLEGEVRRATADRRWESLARVGTPELLDKVIRSIADKIDKGETVEDALTAVLNATVASKMAEQRPVGDGLPPAQGHARPPAGFNAQQPPYGAHRQQQAPAAAAYLRAPETQAYPQHPAAYGHATGAPAGFNPQQQAYSYATGVQARATLQQAYGHLTEAEARAALQQAPAAPGAAGPLGNLFLAPPITEGSFPTSGPVPAYPRAVAAPAYPQQQQPLSLPPAAQAVPTSLFPGAPAPRGGAGTTLDRGV